MKRLLIDFDIADLVLYYDDSKHYFVDAYDDSNIYDEDSLEDKSNAKTVNLRPLILNYINGYSVVTKNENIEKARKEQSIELFYNEIRSNEVERNNFYKYVDEMFCPIYDFKHELPALRISKRFLINYVKDRVSFNNLVAHINSIAKNYSGIERKFFHDFDDIEPSDYKEILNTLFDKGLFKEFSVLAEMLLDDECVSFDFVDGKLKVARFKMREELLLNPDNENSCSFYLQILGEYNDVFQRLKSKFGSLIYSIDDVSMYPLVEPFQVKMRIVRKDSQIESCIKFIQENKGFFDELRNIRHGKLDILLVKEVVYYPHCELEFEDTYEELFEMGVRYRIDFKMGE